MFRLQVWENNRWRWGIVKYDTFSKAKDRCFQLERIGIKARVKTDKELFN